jgi:hypothetical protein
MYRFSFLKFVRVGDYHLFYKKDIFLASFLKKIYKKLFHSERFSYKRVDEIFFCSDFRDIFGQRYLLPKLTMSQPKKIINFSKVLTLKAGTEELVGNKGFYCVVFS